MRSICQRCSSLVRLRVRDQAFIAEGPRRIDVEVKPGATELDVRFDRPEPDARYAVSVTPNWMTPYCVTGKTESGFSVRFGAEASANAKADWIIVR